MKIKTFKHISNKTVSLITAVSFAVSLIYGYAPELNAARTVPGIEMSEPGNYAALDAETFVLPQRLGEVKYSFKGNSGKTVIHIQDAHCNYFAQKRIAEILNYLKGEYGVDMVNLEGGSGAYDVGIFSSVPDRNARFNTADYFLRWGELNGAEFMASTVPGSVSLWGVEDAALYIKNLKVYRASSAYRAEVSRGLNELSSALEALKARIYSPGLLTLDTNYASYKSGKLEFRAYLVSLLEAASANGVTIKGFPNTWLISESLKREKEIDFKKANSERDALVERLKKALPLKELEELAAKTVAMRDESMSRDEFYDYILRKARNAKADITAFPELGKYAEYVKLYHSVDRMALIAEMSDLEDAVREKLYTDPSQRELNKLSKNFVIMKNVFEIALTKSDYRYYTENERSFEVRNYLDFVSKESRARNLDIKLGGGLERLDAYRKEISAFYRYSFERDNAFLANLKFSPSGSAVLMTGGFHTENLCELMKAAGISYVSIMPSFRSEEGYECPYFEILGGAGMSPVEKAVSSSMSAMQVPSLLNELGLQADSEGRVAVFRAAVKVVESFYATRTAQALKTADGEYLVLAFNAEGVPSWKVSKDLPDGVSPADISGLLKAARADVAVAARPAEVPAQPAPVGVTDEERIIQGTEIAKAVKKARDRAEAEDRKGESASAWTGVVFGVSALAVSIGAFLIGFGVSYPVFYLAPGGMAASYMLARAYALRRSVTGAGFFEASAVSDGSADYNAYEKKLREKYDVMTARILAAHETAHDLLRNVIPFNGKFWNFVREAAVLAVEMPASVYLVSKRIAEIKFNDNFRAAILRVGGVEFPKKALDILARPATDANADLFAIELVREQLIPAALNRTFYADAARLVKNLDAMSVYRNLPDSFKSRLNRRINSFNDLVLALSGEEAGLDDMAKERVLRALSKGLMGSPSGAFDRIRGLSNIASAIPIGEGGEMMEAFFTELASGGFSALFADKNRVAAAVNADFGQATMVQSLTAAARYYNEVRGEIRDEQALFKFAGDVLSGRAAGLPGGAATVFTPEQDEEAERLMKESLEGLPYVKAAPPAASGAAEEGLAQKAEAARKAEEDRRLAAEEEAARQQAVDEASDKRGVFLALAVAPEKMGTEYIAKLIRSKVVTIEELKRRVKNLDAIGVGIYRGEGLMLLTHKPETLLAKADLIRELNKALPEEKRLPLNARMLFFSETALKLKAYRANMTRESVSERVNRARTKEDLILALGVDPRKFGKKYLANLISPRGMSFEELKSRILRLDELGIRIYEGIGVSLLNSVPVNLYAKAELINSMNNDLPAGYRLQVSPKNLRSSVENLSEKARDLRQKYTADLSAGVIAEGVKGETAPIAQPAAPVSVARAPEAAIPATEGPAFDIDPINNNLGSISSETSDGMQLSVSPGKNVTVGGRELEIDGRKVRVIAAKELTDYRGVIAVELLPPVDMEKTGGGEVKALAGTDIFGNPTIVLIYGENVTIDSRDLSKAFALAVDSLLEWERSLIESRRDKYEENKRLREAARRLRMESRAQRAEKARDDLLRRLLDDPQMLFRDRHRGIDLATGVMKEYTGEELLIGIMSGRVKGEFSEQVEAIPGEPAEDTKRRAEVMIWRKQKYLDMLRRAVFEYDSSTLGEEQLLLGGVQIGVPSVIRMPSGVIYKRERLIADGGFGSVFEVVELNENGTARLGPDGKEIRKVMKLLRTAEGEITTDPDNAWKFPAFMNEFLVARALKGENWSVGADAAGSYLTSNGARYYYYVMEAIGTSPVFNGESPTLDSLIRNVTLTEEEKLDIARQMINIILELHRRGIVDRDIKPGNLVVDVSEDADGNRKFTVRKVDYGIAVYAPGVFSDPNVIVYANDGGMLVGTPAFMPDEAIRKGECERTDLYALGCSLYELLTGGDKVTTRSPGELEVNYMDYLRGRRADDFSAASRIVSRGTTDKRMQHLELLAAELIRHDTSRVRKALWLEEILHELDAGLIDEFSVLWAAPPPTPPAASPLIIKLPSLQVRNARADTGFYAGLAGAALMVILPFTGVLAAGSVGFWALGYFAGYMTVRTAWLSYKAGFRANAATSADTYDKIREKYDQLTTEFLWAHEYIHNNYTSPFLPKFLDEAFTLALEGIASPFILANYIFAKRLSRVRQLRSLSVDGVKPLFKDAGSAQKLSDILERPVGLNGMERARAMVRFLMASRRAEGGNLALMSAYLKGVTYSQPYPIETQKRLDAFAGIYDALLRDTGMTDAEGIRVMEGILSSVDGRTLWEAFLLRGEDIRRFISVLARTGIRGAAAGDVIGNFMKNLLGLKSTLGADMGYEPLSGFTNFIEALSGLAENRKLSAASAGALAKLAAADIGLVLDAVDDKEAGTEMSVLEKSKTSKRWEFKNRNMTETEAAEIIEKMIFYSHVYQDGEEGAKKRSVAGAKTKKQVYDAYNNENRKFVYACFSPRGHEVMLGKGVVYAGGFSAESGNENALGGVGENKLGEKIITVAASARDISSLRATFLDKEYGVVGDGMGRYRLVVHGPWGEAPVEVNGRDVYVNFNFDLYDQRADMSARGSPRSIFKKEGLIGLEGPPRARSPIDAFVGRNIRGEYVITLLDTQGIAPRMDSSGMKNAFAAGIQSALKADVVSTRKSPTGGMPQMIDVGPRRLWSFFNDTRGLLTRARQLVNGILMSSQRKTMVTYHNEMHFNELFEFLDAVMPELPLQDESSAKTLASLAIYMHDVGYFMGQADDPIARDHESKSIKELEELSLGGKIDLSSEELAAVRYMINRTMMRMHGVNGVDLASEVADDQIAYETLARWNSDKVTYREMKWLEEYVTRKLTFGVSDVREAKVMLFRKETRRMFMDAILLGKTLAVADIYGHSQNYPFLVAYLQGEFKADDAKNRAANPNHKAMAAATAFEQVASSPGFFTFAENVRLNYILDVPMAPGTRAGTRTLRDVVQNAGGKVKRIREDKEKNRQRMVSIGAAIKALRSGDVLGEEALITFIEDGKEAGVFDGTMVAQLNAEIRKFRAEGKAAEAAGTRGASLIGNVKGTDGKTITGGFRSTVDADRLTLEHERLSSPVVAKIAKDVSGRTVTRTSAEIAGPLKTAFTDPATGEIKNVNILTPGEKKAVQGLIDAISSVDTLVGLEEGPVKGYFHTDPATGKSVLFLNKALIGDPLAVLHELGEGMVALPPGYADPEYRHTYLRGVGKDVRTAYLAMAREMGSRRIDAMSVDEFVAALSGKMSSMGLREMTPAETGLIKYNASVGRADRASGKKALLFGLQDSVDPNGNAALTINIKTVSSGFSRGNLNIVLVRNSNIETAQAQEDVGRRAGRAFTKNEVNTQVMHFDADLAEKLDKAYRLAAKNAEKLPKIFVDCLTPEDKAAVESFIRMNPGSEKIILIGNDDIEGVQAPDLKVNEAMVVTVAVALLNDNRMREDLRYSAEDMAAGRRVLLSMLQWSGALDAAIDVTGMSAEELDVLMAGIFRGAIALRITKINWNEISEWNAAQNEVLKSL